MARKQRLPGKKIDTWELEVNKTKVAVEVRMVKFDGLTAFEAFLPEEYGESFRSADINELKVEVTKWLREHLQVTWEEFFHVSFQGLKNHELHQLETLKKKPEVDDNAERFQIDLEYERIEIGTKADGTKCYRSCRHRSSVSDGMPHVGEGKWYNEKSKRYAIVPATNENEEALKQLCLAFKEISTRLYQWLAPDVIEQNLRQLAGRLQIALPGPEKEA